MLEIDAFQSCGRTCLDQEKTTLNVVQSDAVDGVIFKVEGEIGSGEQRYCKKRRVRMLLASAFS